MITINESKPESKIEEEEVLFLLSPPLLKPFKIK